MSTIPVGTVQSGNPPVLPLDFNANQPPKVRVYPFSNYTFGVKETQPEEDPSVIARLKRLEEHYAEHGMRRTCEGILVCHEHNQPHILMLQIANAFFKLPGDYLRPEDDEIEGFKARLDERLAPVGRLGEDEKDGEWEIGECLSQWWRPNFETFMYPFVPAHVTRPKECKKIYLIHLPKNKVLSVPKNMKLLAVPLFELYENSGRYGPQLSAIPHILSRYNFEFVDEDGKVVKVTPGDGSKAGDQPPKTKVLVGDDTDMKEENGTTSIDSPFHAAISSPLLPGETANIARFGSRDSEVLVCSLSGLKLAIFNLSTSKVVEVANPKFHHPNSVGRSYSVRPQTEHLAVLTRLNGKDFVSIHHPVSRQVQKAWAVETVDAQAVCWTPDGKWLMLWEAAAHGHKLVVHTADGQHFRTITGANLSDSPDISLELGIKACQSSHTSDLCAIGDHSRGIVILQTDSWRSKGAFTHPVTIVPQDTLHVWQEQLNTSRDGQTVHTFQRATQPISPPGVPSDGKTIEAKPGCSSLAFDASSTLLATKLDDAPCTIWIWDIAAAELRAVLVFHSVVTFAWHKHLRELLLITSQDESRQGLSYLWDPLLQGPTPVVPEEFISVKNSVGAPIKAQISWINTDLDYPLALLSTAQQYRVLSLGEGDQVPETWQGASKWDNETPRKREFDPDISDISIDDGAPVEDTFSFRKT
ncbi:WD40 domain-containing protein [Cordyceps javanica]|uniref:WD40 domain-containing protein n=1 Tax=Cordyceps javanica TaxID=43265 RepID=A0A545UYL0_9HYPO|nr:WD40 domain-containing protein [Cordyceps javanica]TQW06434.1 WD40 domain protein [Cordyceps javanica]